MILIPEPFAAIPVGFIETAEDRGYSISRAPDGWLVSDADAVTALANSYSGSVAELAFNQGKQLNALAAVYTQKLASGFTYTDGKTYQIDPQSQGNIAAMGSLAASVVNNTPGAPTWPSGFSWIAADNSQSPMTAAQMYAFSQAVAGYVSALIVNNRVLKNAIQAATSMSALQAINLQSGWPA